MISTEQRIPDFDSLIFICGPGTPLFRLEFSFSCSSRLFSGFSFFYREVHNKFGKSSGKQFQLLYILLMLYIKMAVLLK